MANRRASEDEIAKMLRAKRRKAGVTKSGAASKKGNADPTKARQADASAEAKRRVNPTGKGSRLSEAERLSRRTDPTNPNFGRNEDLGDFDSSSVFSSGDLDTERTDVTKKGTKEAKAQATKKDELGKALEAPSATKASYSPTAQKGESNLAEDVQGGFSRDSGPSVSGGSGLVPDIDVRSERAAIGDTQKAEDKALRGWLINNPTEKLFKNEEQYQGWKARNRVGRDVIGNSGAVSAEKKSEVRDRALARERTVRGREFLATTQRRSVPSANPLSPNRVIPPSNPLTVEDAKARQKYLTGEEAKGAGAPMRSVVEQQPDGKFSVVPRPIPNRVTVQSLYSTKVKPAVREAKEAEQVLATAEGLQTLENYAKSTEAPRVTVQRSDEEIARLTEARLGNEEGTYDTANKRYVVDNDIGDTYKRTMNPREAMRASGNPLTNDESKAAFGVGPGKRSTSGILDIGGRSNISPQFREMVAAKRAAADALTNKENPPKWGPDDERLTFEGVPTKDVTTKEGQAAIIEATSKFTSPKTEVGIGSKKLGVTSGATPSLGEMENEEGISDILALKDVPGSNKTEQLRNYIADYTRDPKTGAVSKLPKSRHPDQQNAMYAQLVRNTAGIKGGSNADAYQKGEQVAGEKPVWAGDELDTVVQNPLGFGESLRENRNTFWGEKAESNKRLAKAAGGNIQNQSASKAALAFSINEKTNSILEKMMMPGEGNTAGVAAGHLRAAIDPYRRPDSSYRLDKDGVPYVPDASPVGKKGWQGPTLAGHIQRAEDLDQEAAGAAIEHGEGSVPHRAALRAARGARRFAEMMDKTPGSRGGMTVVTPGGAYGRTSEGVEYSAGPGSDFEGQDQAQREQTRQAKMAGTFQRPPSSTPAEPLFESSSAPGMARSDIRSDESGNLSITPIATETKGGLKPAKVSKAPKLVSDNHPERKAFLKMDEAQKAEHAVKVAKARALGGTGVDINFKGDVPAGTPSPLSDAEKLKGSQGPRGPQDTMRLHLQAGYQSDYATSSYESNPTIPLRMPGRSSPAAAGEVLAVGGRRAGVVVPPTSIIWGEHTGGDETGNGAIRRGTPVYGSPDNPQSKSEYQAALDRKTFDQLEYSKPGPTGIRGSMRGGRADLGGPQYSRPIPAPPGYSASFGESPRSAGRRVASELSEIDAKQGRVSSAMGGGQFNK